MQIVILSIWLGLMGAALWLAFWVIKNSPKSKRARRTFPRRQTRRRPVAVIKHNSGRQWNELLTLLQGDVNTANRLINGEKSRNPTRSADWCVDKALWQLKRDRH
jgi:acyl carrier protein phosphodiesterase